jgi:hypothetical protein
MRRVIALLLVIACEPPAVQQTSPVVTPEAQHADACRNDIPDCAAVCALRETHRGEFIDFYERRCASVILGKNPERVELRVTAAGTSAPTSSGTPSAPFDPVSVTRTGGAEPAECKAGRILRAQKREREADMMDALCAAKGGGDAGT